jgi:hypothetical protein
MALGGEGGSRLARQLGINASGDTFLRELRRQDLSIADRSPRVLGMDDWAWRKGQRYETILCDLEQGKVIDLLSERSEASTEAWIRHHPGTEIVSRDRASYAEAATKAVFEVEILRQCLTSHTVRRSAQAVGGERSFGWPEKC